MYHVYRQELDGVLYGSRSSLSSAYDLARDAARELRQQVLIVDDSGHRVAVVPRVCPGPAAERASGRAAGARSSRRRATRHAQEPARRRE